MIFEQQYNELALAVDLIAERVRALGHPAPATYKEFLKRTSIKEPVGVPKAKAMIQQLLADQGTVVHVVDAGADQVRQLGSHAHRLALSALIGMFGRTLPERTRPVRMRPRNGSEPIVVPSRR